jgi:hypothetical protein
VSPRIVYLHGFASGPQSSKARYFSGKLRGAGAEVVIPALDAGDFQNLTITAQLKVIHEAVDGKPTVLMGSSLGGYLAALYAARHPEIERLVLLAPGFQFPKLWRERYTPEELDNWKRAGTAPVFHYAYNEERQLGYQLMEDSAHYEGEPDFKQSAIIFHGINDSVVPAVRSEAFAATHPNVTLHLMDSGHELTNVIDQMWERSRDFLLGNFKVKPT